MITALSTYKNMAPATYSCKTFSLIAQDLRINSGDANLTGKPAGTSSIDAISVELSVSHKVFSAVDDFFNMGCPARFNAGESLSPEERSQFVRIVAELAKAGYTGYEDLLVDRKVERHEMLMQIGDRRLRKARIYNRPPSRHI